MNLKQSLTFHVLGLILAIFISIFAIALYFANQFTISSQQAVTAQYLQQQVLITKERTVSFFEREQKLIEFGLTNGVYQAWMKDPENQTLTHNAVKDIQNTCNVIFCSGWFLITHDTQTELLYNRLKHGVKKRTLTAEDMAWYNPIITSQKEVYIASSTALKVNVRAIFLDYVVREDDRVLGVVGTFERLDDVLGKLLFREDPNAINLIIDEEKKVHVFDAMLAQQKSNRAFIKFANKDWSSLFPESLRIKLDDQDKTKLADNKLFKINVDSEEYLVAFKHIDAVDWFAVSLYPTSELKVKDNLATFVAVSMMILVLFLAITFVGLNIMIISPLNKLNDVVKRIQQGNYNAKGDNKGLDIIKSLANGVDEMSIKINEQIESLNESNKKLQFERKKADDANEAKSRFLSNMSHEIRTPLNGIFGTLQLVQPSLKDEKSQILVEKALFSAKSLLVIINDILDFSKVEANELVLEASAFSFLEILYSVASDVQASKKNQNVSIDFFVDDGFVDGWLGDAVRTKQILLNLVSNAVKFTEQGHVNIRVLNKQVQDAPVLCFEVADTGIGMSSEFQQLIFKRFSQADSSTTRKYGGTGLGMAITINLIHMMQGKINIESNVGSGTTITTCLPLQKTELVTSTQAAEQQCETPNFSQYKILIAEDSEINQAVIESMLIPTQASLTIVENGQEAVTEFSADHYDLVLMDIQMPVMDGEEAFLRIRQINADVPIAALTANTMEDDVLRYQALGFNAHIGKPILMETLFKGLVELLNDKDCSIRAVDTR